MVCLLALAMCLTGTFSGVTAQAADAGVGILPDYALFDNVEDDALDEGGETLTCNFTVPEILNYTAGTLTLSWVSYGNHSGFHIYRQEGDGGFVPIGTVENAPGEAIVFTDTDFHRGVVYQYKVTAFHMDSVGNETEYSSEVLADVFVKPEKVNVASVAFIQAKRKGSSVTLKWTKSSGATGYEVYQKAGSGIFQLAKRLKGADKRSFTIGGIKEGQAVRFKVRAYKLIAGEYYYSSFSKIKALKPAVTQRVLNKIKELKKKFPDGKYWNHAGRKKFNSNTVTNRPCRHYGVRGLSNCNYYYCPNGVLGLQCYGFAWKMSDLVFGKKSKIRKHHSFKKCKVGDVIRYKGHSVFVTEKHSRYIVVGECNYGDTCIIKWGRKIYKAELKGAAYSSRLK